MTNYLSNDVKIRFSFLDYIILLLFQGRSQRWKQQVPPKPDNMASYPRRQ
jgi:hypothetical protein